MNWSIAGLGNARYGRVVQAQVSGDLGQRIAVDAMCLDDRSVAPPEMLRDRRVFRFRLRMVPARVPSVRRIARCRGTLGRARQTTALLRLTPRAQTPGSARLPDGIRGEVLEYGSGGQPRRWRVQSGGGAVRGPRPLPRGADESCTDRIERDIAGKFEQVALALDKYPSKTSLEDVPHVLVPAVEALRVHAVHLAHPPGQVRLRRLQEQVVVIPHQAEGV